MQTQEQVRAVASARESDAEEFGVTSRKHSAAIEGLHHTASQLRSEVAHRAEEADRCHLEIRSRLSEVHAELLAANRSIRDDVHDSMHDMTERLKRDHIEWRRDLVEQAGSWDTKLGGELSALKKQVDSNVSDSVERGDAILRQAARKDQMAAELAAKADKEDVRREFELLRSMVLKRHDDVLKELLTKADAALLEKKPGWDTVTSALGTQEEALKGIRSARFSACLRVPGPADHHCELPDAHGDK